MRPPIACIYALTNPADKRIYYVGSTIHTLPWAKSPRSVDALAVGTQTETQATAWGGANP
jgi:hypothetical protein